MYVSDVISEVISETKSEDVYLSGFRMEGENLATLIVGKPSTCLRNCQEFPRCRFGVFNLHNKTCHLKSNSSSTVKSIDWMLVATSFKVFDRIPGTFVSDPQAADQGYIDNNAYHTTGTEERCRQLCAVHPRCNAALFYNELDSRPTVRATCYMRQIVKSHFDPTVPQKELVLFLA